MSRTKRNNNAGEALRTKEPYKRSKRQSMLRQFEIDYIRINEDSSITL